MSIKRLSASIEAIQGQTRIGVSQINQLREAAGPKVSEVEMQQVQDFVENHQNHFTREAKELLYQEFGIQVPKEGAKPVGNHMKMKAIHDLDSPEASGLISLSRDRFLVADDAKGILLRHADESVENLASAKKHKSLQGLEGLCLSSDGSQVYALSENKGTIVALSLEENQREVSLGPPEALGKLPKIGTEANKGWEGIDVLPGKFSPTGEDCLVAVHEGYPRRVGVFSLPDLEEIALLKLPTAAHDQMHDLSDIAVHPTSGHLFVLSDESARIMEFALTSTHTAAPGGLLENIQLQTLSSFDLPQDKQRKAEGLSFSDKNTLWVASEGRKDLLEISLS